MIRHLAASLCLAATPAAADIEAVKADGDVMSVAKRLETAIAEAGATIFAKVDHGEGAASVDMDLSDAQLLIFGNPKLGTLAMQQDIEAGLFLPLKMLVYADGDGQTWIAWEEPEDMFDQVNINGDAPFVEQMHEVLANFAEAAKE